MINEPVKGDSPNVEARLRILYTLWFVFISTVTGVAVFTELAVSEGGRDDGNSALPVVFLLFGLSLVAASFFVKGRFLKNSVEKRRVDLVQAGYIIAFAFCESVSLSGMALSFIMRTNYRYALFALGFIGLLLHKPSREHLLNASFGEKG